MSGVVLAGASTAGVAADATAGAGSAAGAGAAAEGRPADTCDSSEVTSASKAVVSTACSLASIVAIFGFSASSLAVKASIVA